MELSETEDTLLLTPDDKRDPHNRAYAENEDNMMDWKGDLIEGKARPKIILSSIEEDDAMVSSAQISQAETEFMDNIFSPELTHPSPVYDEIPLATDEYSYNLANVSSV